jgi:nitroreductase
MTIQPQEILEKLQWRYAVKKFDPSKKISEADWFVLEESLRLAPSSYGLQPWKFIVVQRFQKFVRRYFWSVGIKLK